MFCYSRQYEDWLFMPPVPKGPSRVDILRWKIKALTEEEEGLQANYTVRVLRQEKQDDEIT